MKALIANKTDMISQRKIDYMDAKKYADKNGFIYYETSAKNGTNVDYFFQNFTEILVETYEYDIIQFNEIKSENVSESKKRRCILM